MLNLNCWVEGLQRQVEIDPETGFLANLPSYIRTVGVTEPEKQAYLAKSGVDLREHIETGILHKLLVKLYNKRTMTRPLDRKLQIDERTSEQTLPTDFETRHKKQIYLIFCCLVDKILLKELRRYKMENKEMPDYIKDESMQKSCMVFATMIHLYSKNINDLSVEEMLTELQQPAL